MRVTVLFCLLTVLPLVHAEGPKREPAAVALLKRAVVAQGALPKQGLEDLYIKFEGQVNEPKKGTHSIKREYWFRTADRSFRIRTAAGAFEEESRSERGVLAPAEKRPKPRYWEWARKGKRSFARLELKRTSREHIKNMRAIERDRADFQRIMSMVVLSRNDAEQAALRLGKPGKVRIVGEHPNSRPFVFPAEDKDVQYLVLDLQRAGADPLRLFLHEKDLTVRKVIQFDREHPDKVKFVYYLGGYKVRNRGMLMPEFVSVHTEVPTKKTREKTTQLSGRLSVSLNLGLADEVFSPDGGD